MLQVIASCARFAKSYSSFYLIFFVVAFGLVCLFVLLRY